MPSSIESWRPASRQRRLGGHADAAWRAPPRSPRLAPHQPRLRPRAQPQGQHRWRVEQTRHLARKPRQAPTRVERFGLDLVGLHMHICSGADLEHLGRVADAMVHAVQRAGRDLRAVSGGGGLPIPDREGQAPIDASAHFAVWDKARRRIEAHLGHRMDLEIEPGRYVAGQAGVLLAEVRATKTMGNNHFTVIDAGFNDLVRPAMYGAYCELSLLSRAGEVEARASRPTLVAGPLCESGDVFTQDAGGHPAPRQLPQAHVGDILVFHDAGAYGPDLP